MSFGQRLKNARKNRGMTLRELGEAIDRSESVVQRYESGVIANLDNEIIAKLANALNVNPAYLMGWTEVNPVNTVKIPILGDIACGDPITAEDNIVGYQTRIADDLPKGELFYLRAKGDSMSPDIKSGALVLCRRQPDVESGEIAAVLVNGNTEATLKKVRKINNSILLEPINDDYEPYIVNEDNPATIVGKAVEVTNQL